MDITTLNNRIEQLIRDRENCDCDCPNGQWIRLVKCTLTENEFSFRETTTKLIEIYQQFRRQLLDATEETDIILAELTHAHDKDQEGKR